MSSTYCSFLRIRRKQASPNAEPLKPCSTTKVCSHYCGVHLCARHINTYHDDE